MKLEESRALIHNNYQDYLRRRRGIKNLKAKIASKCRLNNNDLQDVIQFFPN